VEDKRFTIRADEAFYCLAQMAYEREKSTGEVSYTAISFSCQPDGEPLPLSHHVHSTASRSLLSFVRHDYFRRILCGWMADKVDRGEFPRRMDDLTMIAKKLCYENARDMIGGTK